MQHLPQVIQALQHTLAAYHRMRIQYAFLLSILTEEQFQYFKLWKAWRFGSSPLPFQLDVPLPRQSVRPRSRRRTSPRR